MSDNNLLRQLLKYEPQDTVPFNTFLASLRRYLASLTNAWNPRHLAGHILLGTEGTIAVFFDSTSLSGTFSHDFVNTALRLFPGIDKMEGVDTSLKSHMFASIVVSMFPDIDGISRNETYCGNNYGFDFRDNGLHLNFTKILGRGRSDEVILEINHDGSYSLQVIGTTYSGQWDNQKTLYSYSFNSKETLAPAQRDDLNKILRINTILLQWGIPLNTFG